MQSFDCNIRECSSILCLGMTKGILRQPQIRIIAGYFCLQTANSDGYDVMCQDSAILRP